MTKASALYDFWSSFGIPAYEENSVPVDAQFPYITYEVVTDSFNSDVMMTASVWYRSTSWIDANAKAEEISQRIGHGGIILNGIWITRATPFSQSMSDSNDNLIKRKILNISAEYMAEN